MAEEKNVITPTEPTQEELNEILQVRRDKLKNLQENGKNPFEITKYNYTHTTKQIKENFEALENTDVSMQAE